MAHMEVSQKRGYLIGVPITRTLWFWGSILGYPYLGQLPYMKTVLKGLMGNCICMDQQDA